MSQQAELQRQQALLGALWSPQLKTIDLIVPLANLENTSANLTLAISAYRNNGLAIAERALAAAFPTVAALLGEAGFAALARNCWRAHPPVCGDLGEYGAQLAAFITEQTNGTELAQLPYLADCARLDWALHQAERAADTPVFEVQRLAVLQSTDPANLHLELAASVALVSSSYPIVALLQAHASGDFEYAGLLLAAEQGEHALVARNGWRATATAVSRATAAFCAACLAGQSLAASLDAALAAPQAEGEDDGSDTFDFGAWLGQAQSGAWLKVISVRPD